MHGSGVWVTLQLSQAIGYSLSEARWNRYTTFQKLRLKQLHCALPGESLLANVRTKDRMTWEKQKRDGHNGVKESESWSSKFILSHRPATKVRVSFGL